MTEPLFLILGYGITTEIIISIVILLLLCLISCYWIRNKIGRCLLIFLIISAWWSSVNLTGDSSVKLDLQNTDAISIISIGDLAINGTIFYSWIVMAVLTVISWLATKNLKTTLRVSHLQTAMEAVVRTIRSQIIDVSGDNPTHYIPIMGTFFLFIGMSNLMTVIPWFRAPTASLSTTIAFAICVFFAMPIYGVKNAGFKGYLKKYIDPTPIMLPLNILSDFSSTFSLAFRLYGNMLSGAIIASVLMMLAPFLVPLPMQILGLVTGTIQAYIFALLAIVYVSAVSPKDKFIDKLEFY
jgi:F-type H+-transporting ATPase subunit a